MNNNLLTFREIKEQFGLKINRYVSFNDQIKYAGNHGIEIELVENKKKEPLFMIKNNVQNTFTKEQIIKKYKGNNTTSSDFVNYAKKRGVTLRHITTSKRPQYFEIIEDKINSFEGKVYPKDNNIEVSKEGFIRNRDSKQLLGSKNALGYIQYRNNKNMGTLVHRAVMETFNPIIDSDNGYVDHIDGNRENNNLNNLRGTTPKENMMFKRENGDILLDKLGIIIQKVGYTQTECLLENIIDKF